MSTKIRCPWCEGDELYVRYHDEERGVPVYDDRTQFEFLVLEGAQAGLSRLTILKRRDGYQRAFADWDCHQVAEFGPDKIEQLLQDPGIIRNRRKIESAIRNAAVFLQIQQEVGSFSDYIRWFTDGKVIDNQLESIDQYVSSSPLSEQISVDLKQRGMSFVGPTIIYAHLQATGIVNDHLVSCRRYPVLVS